VTARDYYLADRDWPRVDESFAIWGEIGASFFNGPHEPPLRQIAGEQPGVAYSQAVRWYRKLQQHPKGMSQEQIENFLENGR